MNKVATRLQSVWRQVSYIVYFRIQTDILSAIHDLPEELQTPELDKLLIKFESAGEEVKAELIRAYKAYAREVKKHG